MIQQTEPATSDRRPVVNEIFWSHPLFSHFESHQKEIVCVDCSNDKPHPRGSFKAKIPHVWLESGLYTASLQRSKDTGRPACTSQSCLDMQSTEL